MRVNKMFSKGKCFDPYANSLNSSLRKYMQIKLENFCIWILGHEELKHKSLLLRFGHVSR